MFRDEDTGEWRPNHIEKRRKLNGSNGAEGQEEWEYIEDPDSTEGATYPIQGMGAFITTWLQDAY
jgi:actin-related protein 9